MQLLVGPSACLEQLRGGVGAITGFDTDQA
jgi:hypothetical protein